MERRFLEDIGPHWIDVKKRLDLPAEIEHYRVEAREKPNASRPLGAI